MLDLEAIVRRAVRTAQAAPVAIAAPFDVPERLVHDLAAEGVVHGYISNAAPDPKRRDPLVVGWWVDRRAGCWYLDGTGPDTLLVLGAGPGHHVSGRMLLEARLKGVRRVVLVGNTGEILRDVDAEAALLDALDRSLDGERLGEATFEDIYEELYERVGDKLRLPPESFAQDRAVLMLGGLGPGGAERQAAYTAIGLKQRTAYDVHIGCNHILPPNDFFAPAIKAAGAHVAMVPDWAEEFNAPEINEIRTWLSRYDALGFQNVFYAIFHYALMIRSLRPALVHTWMDYCNVLAGTAAELVGVPHLVLSGRSVAPDNFRLFQPYMRPGYEALLRRRSDVLFLNNSRAGAADYARWLGLGPERVRVVHNGFEFPPDISRAAGMAVRREHGIPEEARVVGSILRFSEEKRPGLLIEMARRLLDRDPGLRFLFFGSGVLLEEMRAYVASLGLTNTIVLPGLTRDAWSALAAMDVFTLASRMEGLPNVMIEAQAAGLAVVCTGVGGMTETFVEGETGHSVPEATPEALAQAVHRLLTTPGLLEQMSARAFAHAREAFGVGAMLQSTLEAYRAAGAVVPTSPHQD